MFLGQRQGKASSKPDPRRTYVDKGSKHARGCQVRSINGSTVTLKVQLEPNWVGDRTCDAAVFAGHTPVVGASCYALLNPANGYAIISVHPSGPIDNAAEAAYLRDRVTFSPGFVRPEWL